MKYVLIFSIVFLVPIFDDNTPDDLPQQDPPWLTCWWHDCGETKPAEPEEDSPVFE